jgi:hypothetical protein
MAPNTTHGVYRNSPCGRQVIRAFLAHPDAPVDTTCFQTEPGSFTFATR